MRLLRCAFGRKLIGTVERLAQLAAKEGTHQRARSHRRELSAATADLRAQKAAGCGAAERTNCLFGSCAFACGEGQSSADQCDDKLVSHGGIPVLTCQLAAIRPRSMRVYSNHSMQCCLKSTLRSYT